MNLKHYFQSLTSKLKYESDGPRIEIGDTSLSAKDFLSLLEVMSFSLGVRGRNSPIIGIDLSPLWQSLFELSSFIMGLNAHTLSTSKSTQKTSLEKASEILQGGGIVLSSCQKTLRNLSTSQSGLLVFLDPNLAKPLWQELFNSLGSKLNILKKERKTDRATLGTHEFLYHHSKDDSQAPEVSRLARRERMKDLRLNPGAESTDIKIVFFDSLREAACANYFIHYLTCSDVERIVISESSPSSAEAILHFTTSSESSELFNESSKQVIVLHEIKTELLSCVRRIRETTRRLLLVDQDGLSHFFYTVHHPFDAKDPFRFELDVCVSGEMLKVVDQTGVLLRPGEVGEVIVFQLSHREEKISTKFQGLQDAQQRIFVSSEIDQVIKVGHTTVPRQMIERVICAIEGVTHCSATSTDDASGIKVIVSTKSGNITKELILNHCRNQLPIHLVPVEILI